MEINLIINNLESNIQVFEGLCANITQEQSKWKPSNDKWSMLEVVNHLIDIEILDCRERVDKLLNNDNNWTPIDPEEWVVSKKYNEREFKNSLINFVQERRSSIKWLHSLNNKDWHVPLYHPKLGTFTAYKMLSCWLVHDYLHIRQLTRLKYQYIEKFGKNDRLEYAGKW